MEMNIQWEPVQNVAEQINPLENIVYVVEVFFYL